ncbi:MAG: septum formation initiator family protein [Gammaproteobacteria bacterium]|nr:septum formation initiator family protein [Gammaproteobacteria bacterium]
MISKLFYKITWVILLYFLCLGVYKLVYSDESVLTYLTLQDDLVKQRAINKEKININTALYAEVDSLKKGYIAVEERARNDLGLIKKGETFYQIIEE